MGDRGASSGLVNSPAVILRPACLADAQPVAAALRLADREELAASHPGKKPEVLIREFIRASRYSVCLCWRGEPVAVAGLYVPVWLGNKACIWLLTGQHIERCKVSFVRAAKRQLSRWLTVYSVLENEVDFRYRAARRLVRHLGGQLGHSVTQYNGISFLHFTFRRNTWEEF